jgi:tRNA uracil 4-sulfurtransferase
MERGVALLSGGIDSPVAIHLMKDRLEIIAAHFHQKPLSDEKEIEKVKKLAAILGIKKVYLVGFTDVLKELVKCNHRDYYILSKIAMFRCAEMIAVKEDAKYLITGENLAQVSSQTLSNLHSITKNVEMEIFRPVLTRDKQEIMDKAKEIGTFEVSQGAEICCLLGPKNPSTKSDPQRIKAELEKFDLNGMLNESLKKAEVFDL